MPTRDNAIVLCSCGRKWGDAARARTCEEMEDLEHATVAGHVAVYLLHWKLGHKLTGRGGLAVWALIQRAAAQLAKQDA